MHPYAGKHLLDHDGLGDVVDTAGLKSPDDVLCLPERPVVEHHRDVVGAPVAFFNRRQASKPSKPGITASSRMIRG